MATKKKAIKRNERGRKKSEIRLVKNVQFISLCRKLYDKNFETKKRGAEKQNAYR